MAFAADFLTPVLGWLFQLPPWLAILFMSAVLAIVGTLLQKYLTDQAKLKRLREDTKKFQKQYKELAKTDPEKALKLQQKMFPIQMDMMKEGFKPMIATMIPFLFIALWMGSHFAYEPILPNEPFTVSALFAEGVVGNATLTSANGVVIDQATKDIVAGSVTWNLRAPAGQHTVFLSAANGVVADNRTVLVTTAREYETPLLRKDGAIVREFNIGNAKLTPFGDVSLFGWKPGWIAVYILLSIPISLLLRKVMGVV